MEKNKPNKITNLQRRRFLMQAGLGTLTLAGLNSCSWEDVNFIGKIKNLSSPSAKPIQKDIDDLLVANGELEALEITLKNFKEKLLIRRDISDEIKQLLSEEKIKDVVQKQIEYFYEFYTQNFVASDIKELTKMYKSEIWKKLRKAREATSGESVQKSEVPSIKYMAEVNKKYKELNQNKQG